MEQPGSSSTRLIVHLAHLICLREVPPCIESLVLTYCRELSKNGVAEKGAGEEHSGVVLGPSVSHLVIAAIHKQ